MIGFSTKRGLALPLFDRHPARTFRRSGFCYDRSVDDAIAMVITDFTDAVHALRALVASNLDEANQNDLVTLTLEAFSGPAVGRRYGFARERVEVRNLPNGR